MKASITKFCFANRNDSDVKDVQSPSFFDTTFLSAEDWNDDGTANIEYSEEESSEEESSEEESSEEEPKIELSNYM